MRALEQREAEACAARAAALAAEAERYGEGGKGGAGGGGAARARGEARCTPVRCALCSQSARGQGLAQRHAALLAGAQHAGAQVAALR